MLTAWQNITVLVEDERPVGRLLSYRITIQHEIRARLPSRGQIH